MYRLNLPSHDSNDVYDLCVSSIREEAMRNVFTGAALSVGEKCTDFDTLANDSNLGLAVSSKFNIDEIGGEYSMASLYDQQFTQNQPTRSIRDSIKNAAPNSLCPYCGDGLVSELDHYLPKSRFAGVAVHPANLVPSCGDCNYAKRNFEPRGANEALLHPYFDDVLNTGWLVAVIIQTASGGPVVEFFVSESIEGDLLHRLNNHLDTFKLRERYRSRASQLLSDYDQKLRITQDRRDYLREHLGIASGDRANAWKLATFRAMLNSHWYLDTYLNTTDSLTDRESVDDISMSPFF